MPKRPSILTAATTIVDDVEAALFAPAANGNPWKKRPLDPWRVYRLMVRYPESTRPFDVILPEHHVARGRGDVRQPHACDVRRCRQTVRLPVVGCEDVLAAYARWWRLVCEVNRWRLQTICVEQPAYVAQEEIKALGYHPAPLFTLAQATAMDLMVRTETDAAGVERWFYV